MYPPVMKNGKWTIDNPRWMTIPFNARGGFLDSPSQLEGSAAVSPGCILCLVPADHPPRRCRAEADLDHLDISRSWWTCASEKRDRLEWWTLLLVLLLLLELWLQKSGGLWARLNKSGTFCDCSLMATWKRPEDFHIECVKIICMTVQNSTKVIQRIV